MPCDRSVVMLSNSKFISVLKVFMLLTRDKRLDHTAKVTIYFMRETHVNAKGLLTDGLENVTAFEWIWIVRGRSESVVVRSKGVRQSSKEQQSLRVRRYGFYNDELFHQTKRGWWLVVDFADSESFKANSDEYGVPTMSAYSKDIYIGSLYRIISVQSPCCAAL